MVILLLALGMPSIGFMRIFIAQSSPSGGLGLGSLPADNLAFLAVSYGLFGSFAGLSAIAQEKQNGSFQSTRLAIPHQSRILLGKSASVSFVFGIAGVAGMALGILGAKYLYSVPVSFTSETFDQVWKMALALLLMMNFGLAVGFCFCSGTGAFLMLAMIVGVLSPALPLLFGQNSTFVDFTPMSAIQAVATVSSTRAYPMEGVPVSHLDRTQGAMVIAIWLVAAVLTSLLVNAAKGRLTRG